MIQRTFFPGGEWLYFKIYTGHKNANSVLTKMIYPFFRKYQKKGYVNNFFFVRYHDPEFHIRIRFKLTKDKYNGELLNNFYRLLNKYQQENWFWKISLDTYIRELERYENIELAESIFYYDSCCVLELLQVEGITLWHYALKLIDDLFEIFHYSIDQKIFLSNNLQQMFKNEYHFKNHSEINQLDKKYRKYSEEVSDILTHKTHLFLNTNPILEQRNQAIRNTIRSEDLSIINDGFIGSIIHMLMNKLFIYENRLYELVIYDFLYRFYKSKKIIDFKQNGQ